MLCQKTADAAFVFRRSKGAGRIYQSAAGYQHPGGTFQNAVLSVRTELYILRAPFLTGHFILPEHSLSGAGCIHQNSVKRAQPFAAQLQSIVLQCFNALHTQTGSVFGNQLQLVLVDVAGDNLALILHKLCHVRCLAARSAAHIQHAHSGLRCQHRRYQHGAFVLNIKMLRQCRQKCMQRRQMLCHNTIGTPFGSTHLRTHFRQIRQQLIARSHQRIGTQANRRSRVIKRQQTFGAAASPWSQPALHQPARMVVFQ